MRAAASFPTSASRSAPGRSSGWRGWWARAGRKWPGRCSASPGRTRGDVLLDGKPVVVRSPREAMRHGLAMVPEDRQHHGVLMPASVWQNATLPVAGQLSRLGWLRRRGGEEGDRRVRPAVPRPASVHPTTHPRIVRRESQKIVLAKWLMTKPRVMILDEPTRGIDIGAKAEVHRLVAELAAAGVAVLMISSELPEVLAMSDRVLVMREGRLVEELSSHEASPERVIAAATGQAEAGVHAEATA